MGLEDFGNGNDEVKEKSSPSSVNKIRAMMARYDIAAPVPGDDDNEEGDLFKVNKSQWAICGSGEYTGIQKTQKTLTSGVYRTKLRNGEVILSKADINVDSLLESPNSISDKILSEVSDFWAKADLFDKYGFLHRRGYLIYGSAGGGKTSLVQQIIKKIIDRKGLVFLCDNPQVLALGLATFREIEPDRNVVCIFEDLDSIIDTFGEDTILSILDGEMQIDKVLNIATTNYPEKLDRRIVGRPRRFDRVIKIGMPDDVCRRLYFSTKLSIENDELNEWVKKTEDFSFAAMAELVISVKCLGHTLNESVKTLRALLDSKPTSVGDGKSVGFSGR